jgi:hypothetical protein
MYDDFKWSEKRSMKIDKEMESLARKLSKDSGFKNLEITVDTAVFILSSVGQSVYDYGQEDVGEWTETGIHSSLFDFMARKVHYAKKNDIKAVVPLLIFVMDRTGTELSKEPDDIKVYLDEIGDEFVAEAQNDSNKGMAYQFLAGAEDAGVDLASFDDLRAFIHSKNKNLR